MAPGLQPRDWPSLVVLRSLRRRVQQQQAVPAGEIRDRPDAAGHPIGQEGGDGFGRRPVHEVPPHAQDSKPIPHLQASRLWAA